MDLRVDQNVAAEARVAHAEGRRGAGPRGVGAAGRSRTWLAAAPVPSAAAGVASALYQPLPRSRAVGARRAGRGGNYHADRADRRSAHDRLRLHREGRGADRQLLSGHDRRGRGIGGGERAALLPRDHARRARGRRSARRRIRPHHLAVELPSSTKRRTGEVISRLTADTTQIKAAAGTSISIALRNFVLFFGATAMMVVTSPQLSAFVLAAIPVIVLPLFAFGRAVRRRSRSAQDTLADASAYAAELIGAVRVLQAFTNERLGIGRFRDAVERAYAAARNSIRARAALTGIAIFLVASSVIVVFWIGAQQVLAGRSRRTPRPVHSLCGARRQRARPALRNRRRSGASLRRGRAAVRIVALRAGDRGAGASVGAAVAGARRGRLRGRLFFISHAAGCISP